MLTRRSISLGLVAAGAVLFGCLLGRLAPAHAVAGPEPPAPARVRRWDHHCVQYTPGGPDASLTDQARALGRDGWEMVTATPAAWGASVGYSRSLLVCFKRPLD